MHHARLQENSCQVHQWASRSQREYEPASEVGTLSGTQSQRTRKNCATDRQKDCASRFEGLQGPSEAHSRPRRVHEICKLFRFATAAWLICRGLAGSPMADRLFDEYQP